MQSTHLDPTAAISTVFHVAHDLLESIGAHDVVIGSNDSAISLTAPLHTEYIFIDAREGLTGIQLAAKFRHNDYAPEYTAGQWRIDGEQYRADLVERWHPLAALAAAVVDIAQAKMQATARFKAVTFS